MLKPAEKIYNINFYLFFWGCIPCALSVFQLQIDFFEGGVVFVFRLRFNAPVEFVRLLEFVDSGFHAAVDVGFGLRGAADEPLAKLCDGVGRDENACEPFGDFGVLRGDFPPCVRALNVDDEDKVVARRKAS